VQSHQRPCVVGEDCATQQARCHKRDLRRVVCFRRNANVTPEDFEKRLVAWARKQSDIHALILAGSRAKEVPQDRWADWDFHIISSSPRRYYGTEWLWDIAPVWCAHSEVTPRMVTKVSAVFADGLEVDFVPLAAWQMKLVYFFMNYPGWQHWMPRRLFHGILETRAFLLGSGYNVLIGGVAWENRLQALFREWPAIAMHADECRRHCSAFWQKAVWVFKKIARPEIRSAIHWLHKLVLDHSYVFLAEEARLAGRQPRPEARKAEKWLDAGRLAQTAITTGPDQKQLASVLLDEIALFEDVSRHVADVRGFTLPDHSAVAGWLRSELLMLCGSRYVRSSLPETRP